MGSYLFKWPYPADHVYVTGTFDDWGMTEKLDKVGDGFEKLVILPSADEKVMFKFVVDDQWIVDEHFPKEDDGHYNVNNVLLPSQIKSRHHRVLSFSSAPPGSSNRSSDAAIVHAGGSAAPLLTKEQSIANLERWVPHTNADPSRPVTRTLPGPNVGASRPASSSQSAGSTTGNEAVAPAGGLEAAPATKEISGAPPTDTITSASTSHAAQPATSAAADTQSGHRVLSMSDKPPGAGVMAGAAAGVAAVGAGAAAVASRVSTGHKVLSTSDKPPGSSATSTTGNEALAPAGGLEAAPNTKEVSGAAPTDTTSAAGTSQSTGTGTAVAPAGGLEAAPNTKEASGAVPTSTTDDVSSGTAVTSGKPIHTAPHVSAGGSGAPLITKEQSMGNLSREMPNIVPSSDRPVTRTIPSDAASSATTATSSSHVPFKSEVQGPLITAPHVSAGGSGAPLIGKEMSQRNLDRPLPNIKPDSSRSVTRTLAAPAAAAAVAPELEPAVPQTDSTAASKATPEEVEDKVPGAFPETPAVEKDAFSVDPIPASGHNNIQSSVTTSKEEYENAGGEGTANQTVGVQPVPATGHQDTQTSATTSKQDYERLGALGAAGAAVGGVGAAIASAFSRPKKDDKNIIPESSLPMDASKTDTMDSGPTIRSSGPDTTTGALASQVPLEPKREATQIEPSQLSGSGLTTFNTNTPDVLSSKKDANVVDPASTNVPQASQMKTNDATVTPFIQSSGPATTTADLAAKQPLESEAKPSTGASGLTMFNTNSPDVLDTKKDADKVDPATTNVPQASSMKTNDATVTPTIQSSGPGTTTADLAAQQPLERTVSPIATTSNNAPATSEVTGPTQRESSHRGVTTAAVGAAAGVLGAGGVTAALHEHRQQAAPMAATGVSSAPSGSQSTSQSLATESAVPADVSEAVVAEKSEMEKELLSKVPTSNETGAPASAAKTQSSFYGLATAVPEPVEASMAQAGAPPEAASQPSVVAEKSMMERELQARVPQVDAAGEPAPTVTASTSAVAPSATTSSTAPSAPGITGITGQADPKTGAPPNAGYGLGSSTSGVSDSHYSEAAGVRDAISRGTGASSTGAAALTDGRTANETVPGTDSGNMSRGAAAGAIAGGAAAGGIATYSAYNLITQHHDRDAAPPVVAEANRPATTSEAAPATKIEPATRVPGSSPSAAAQVADGSSAITPGLEAPVSKAPLERTEGDATDYAPPRPTGIAPGVSSSAGAAISDGTEDPTALEEDHHRSAVAPGAMAAGTAAGGLGAAALASHARETPTTGLGTASSHAGVSPVAAAALNDGTEDPTSGVPTTSHKSVIDKSEGATSEYAPPRPTGVAPGVSPVAAAALSDGTEDPTGGVAGTIHKPAVPDTTTRSSAALPDSTADSTLAQEPAVQMMRQNEAPTYDAVTSRSAGTGAVTGATAGATAGLAASGATGPITSTTADRAPVYDSVTGSGAQTSSTAGRTAGLESTDVRTGPSTSTGPEDRAPVYDTVTSGKAGTGAPTGTSSALESTDVHTGPSTTAPITGTTAVSEKPVTSATSGPMTEDPDLTAPVPGIAPAGISKNILPHDDTAVKPVSGTPVVSSFTSTVDPASSSSAATGPSTPKKNTALAAASTAAAGGSATPSTPGAKSTTSTMRTGDSTPGADGKKKKRNRLSAMFKKIFD